MEHMVCQLNYWAIVVAVVAVWLIGGIWFAPGVFGKTWMKAVGIGKKEMRGSAGKHILWVVFQLLTAFVLAVVLAKFGAKNVQGALCGAFWVWLGFAVPLLVNAMLWGKLKFKGFLVQAGFVLVSYSVIALLVSLWQCSAK